MLGRDHGSHDTGRQGQAVLPVDDATMWRSAHLTSRASMRQMIASGRGGWMILLGSVHSSETSALKAPNGTAMHGLEGLAKVIAKAGAAQVALIFAAFPINVLAGQSLTVSHGWCMQ